MVISSRLGGTDLPGSVSPGMAGSPGCDLGTVTVLVTRPHRTGRRRLDNAVIESWRSTPGIRSCGESGPARPGRRPGAGVAAWVEGYHTARRHPACAMEPRWPGGWPAAGGRPRGHEPAAARARPGRRLAAARRRASRAARASVSAACSPAADRPGVPERALRPPGGCPAPASCPAAAGDAAPLPATWEPNDRRSPMWGGMRGDRRG